MAHRGVHNDNLSWTPHIRVAWGGLFADSGEIWTNSIKFVPSGSAVITKAQADAASGGVWQALSAWFQSQNGAYISTLASMDYLKINSIQASGLQLGDTNIYDHAATAVSGSQAVIVPLYQTFALTLRTDFARGRAHAGRIFPPTVAPALEAPAGRCTVADANRMSAAFNGALAGMQTALRGALNGDTGKFNVLSPGNIEKARAPLANPITGVATDTAPDVQHRRTNRLLRNEGARSPVPA